MTDKSELKEKIAKIFLSVIVEATRLADVEHEFNTKELADQILSLIKENFPALAKEMGWTSSEDTVRLTAHIKALHQERKGEVWFWQGDGEDHLESLSCPLLINPQDISDMAKEMGYKSPEEVDAACNDASNMTLEAIEMGKISTGYVKLAEDQTLPKFSFSEEPPNMRFGYQQAQQDMLAANFRKVEL